MPLPHRQSVGYARGTMRLTLVRHATLLIDIAGTRILVDPAFDPAGSQPPVDGTPIPRPNPLVELPATPAQVVGDVDAVIVTHLHQDHLDGSAARLIADLPVYCQPDDVARLVHLGLAPTAIDGPCMIGAVALVPTSGHHGTGALGDSLGPVGGVVLRAADEPTVYVAGDTVLCDEVRQVIVDEGPDIVVVNAGAARFIVGDPITMDADDVVGVARLAAQAAVVVVHMESFNHCLLGREDLRARLAAEGLTDRVHVLDDGTAIAG
jgi:L-ascorbate metabolism protein UlaG (beta-lactamase superfamily)